MIQHRAHAIPSALVLDSPNTRVHIGCLPTELFDRILFYVVAAYCFEEDPTDGGLDETVSANKLGEVGKAGISKVKGLSTLDTMASTDAPERQDIEQSDSTLDEEEIERLESCGPVNIPDHPEAQEEEAEALPYGESPERRSVRLGLLFLPVGFTDFV